MLIDRCDYIKIAMRTKELDNLVQVKLALAEKTLRKARASSSKPRRAILHRLVARFRQQARDLEITKSRSASEKNLQH
jgi:hypothetical protein